MCSAIKKGRESGLFLSGTEGINSLHASSVSITGSASFNPPQTLEKGPAFAGPIVQHGAGLLRQTAAFSGGHAFVTMSRASCTLLMASASIRRALPRALFWAAS